MTIDALNSNDSHICDWRNFLDPEARLNWANLSEDEKAEARKQAETDAHDEEFA